MTLSVRVLFAREDGELREEGDARLELGDEQATTAEVRRRLEERYDRLARACSGVSIIDGGGKQLADADHVGAGNGLRAVFTERKHRPHVRALRPAMGLTHGGSKVEVSGENLTALVRSVKFGETVVRAMRESNTLLTCIAPEHAEGVVDVEVDAPGEGFTSDGVKYTYVSSYAQAAELAVGVCDERGALSSAVGVETCRPIDSFLNRRE